MTQTASSRPGPTVAARLNRLPITRKHWLAVLVVGVGIFFDMYEVFLTGTLSTVLTHHFSVTKGELKPILASAFVGAFIGAILLSRLADRLGRRRAFFLTLGLYSVFSLVGAFSVNVPMLLICRFMAGVGIGGELPLCDSYLGDILPARFRGRMTGWAYVIGFCGVPAAGFLARGIATGTQFGVAGWRWMFVLGGLGSAVCWVLRRGLPESPRWLEAVGRQEEADAVVARLEAQALKESGGRPLPDPEHVELPPRGRVPMRNLFVPAFRRRTVMLWIFHCLQTFGYYGFGTLVPVILATKGYTIGTSLKFAALTFIGYPLGSLLALPVIERLERKTLVVSGALAMAAAGIVFGYSTTSSVILIAGLCYTAASNFFASAFHIYQAELYPTALRATGAGAAYSLSRLASAAMPFVLLPLLDATTPTTLFLTVAAAMVVLVLDVGLLGPKTNGQALERLTDGRPSLAAARGGRVGAPTV